MFAARMDAVSCLFIANLVGSTDEHDRSGYQKIAHQVFVVASFVHAGPVQSSRLIQIAGSPSFRLRFRNGSNGVDRCSGGTRGIWLRAFRGLVSVIGDADMEWGLGKFGCGKRIRMG